MRFYVLKHLKLVALSQVAVTLAALGFFAVSTDAITTGYKTDDTELVPGMVAALSGESDAQQSKVERATLDNVTKTVGVTTTIDDSFVTVASGNSQVYVENQGEINGYVANANGSVKRGDLLTISPLKGILMKANKNSTVVLAVAAEDFSDNRAESYSVNKIDGGGQKNVLIERLRINLDHKGVADQGLSAENALQRIGRSIVGKEVGTFRLVVALVVFFLVMITEGAILYGTISSAITSLGRNPLARVIIRREVLRVFVVVGLVLLVGLGAIYAILWV